VSHLVWESSLFLLALAVGALFFFMALVIYFPIYSVIVGTAFAGTAITIGGVLVLLGQVDLAALEHFPIRSHRILRRRSSWRIRLV
jgi:hypothetical protein